MGLSLVTGKDVALGALLGATGAIVAEKLARAFDSPNSTFETRMRAAAAGNFITGAGWG